MSAATNLEAQYAMYSERQDYGSAEEGVRLFDLDASQYVKPEAVGLSGDLDAVNDLMLGMGADPDHIKYTTVCLFGPNSPDATIAGTSARRLGYVSRLGTIEGDDGLRFPRINLRYDPENPDPALLNSVLRHEVRHLFDKDSVALYNNSKYIERMKAASATAGALLTSATVSMLDPALAASEMRSGTELDSYVDTLSACMVGTIATAAMTYGLVHNRYSLTYLMSMREHRADWFSYQNRHINVFDAK